MPLSRSAFSLSGASDSSRPPKTGSGHLVQHYLRLLLSCTAKGCASSSTFVIVIVFHAA